MESMTLLSLAKRTENGAIAKIAEVLNKDNAILDDAIWVRANGPTSHITTKRKNLPTGSWRKVNKGVKREKSDTGQLTEGIGMLEAFSQVDEAVVDLAPDKPAFRLSEDLAFIEGLGQTLASTLIYGNRKGNPEEINGLATRYNSIDLANVLNAGGSGNDLTSIWVVQWGEDKVHMVYPKNSETIGITHTDDGLITVYDEDKNPYKVFQSHFKVKPGLVIRDDRCIQRICNIETAGSSNIFDPQVLVKALREMPMGGSGAVIYANKTILAQMDINAMDKTNVNYNADNPFGRPQMDFRGIATRQVDSILDSETAVVA